MFIIQVAAKNKSNGTYVNGGVLYLNLVTVQSFCNTDVVETDTAAVNCLKSLDGHPSSQIYR